MKRLFILITIITVFSATGYAARLKDIAGIEGVRGNQLIGYGIVVGLDGTGDSQQTLFTARSVANMLQNYGITVQADKIKMKNVAAVMITATLPAFARPGSAIDVTISSLGDARSMQGGTLLQTPLRAANGDVYAVAQGPISVGGFNASGGGASVQKNHPTVGRIPGGALIERETKTDITQDGVLRITLQSNDFTTAVRVANAIDDVFGMHIARALDANVISVDVPESYRSSVTSMIAEIEAVEINTDAVAKVVVNERTGTVIIGSQARILPIAVSHGSLTVEISTEFDVSQPKPVSRGTTEVTSEISMDVNEEPAHLIKIDGGATIEELIRALNAIKVTSRDLIAILQAIKEAGALQAQLEVI